MLGTNKVVREILIELLEAAKHWREIVATTVSEQADVSSAINRMIAHE